MYFQEEKEANVATQNTIIVKNVLLWDKKNEKYRDDIYCEAEFSETYIRINKFCYEFSLEPDDLFNLTAGMIKVSNELSGFSVSGEMIAVLAEDALRIQQFYKEYYDNLVKTELLYELVTEKISKDNDGLDELADILLKSLNNEFKNLSTDIFLRRDFVLVMQRKLGSSKYREINIYNEKAVSILVGMAMRYILGAAKALKESGSTSIIIESLLWEALKRRAILQYAQQWENEYDVCLCNNLEADDGNISDINLSKYIENIISCNEIDASSERVIAIFTYYVMSKENTDGIQFFPKTYDLLKEKIEAAKSLLD